MDLKICTLNEVRQTEEDKYIIYMLNLKKNATNEPIYTTEIESQTTDVENKLLVTKVGGKWRDNLEN